LCFAFRVRESLSALRVRERLELLFLLGRGWPFLLVREKFGCSPG